MTVEERRLYNLEYQRKNKERLAERRRTPECAAARLAYNRKYKSTVAYRERRKALYWANLEASRERRRVWARINKPHRTRDARKKANARGSAVGKVDYEAIMAGWDGICHICRCPVVAGQKTHFDHIIPLARGGPHTQDNVSPAHAVCNLRKQDKLTI